MTRAVRFGGSELLCTKLPAWRSRLVMLALFLAFGSLVARAAYLQIVSDEFLQEQGAKRMERTIPLPAVRGRLVDRNNSVLAQSIPVETVWYDGRRLSQAKREQLVALAKLLDKKPDALIKKVKNDSKRHFAYLERKISPDLAASIRALKIPGIGFTPDSKRFYPQGESMAHLVGFTNLEDKGQEGVELAFNRELTGFDGERNILRTRLGDVIEETRPVRPPVNGKDVVLSVDADVQYIVLSELKKAVELHKAKAAAAVVLDAKTGELLAMANIPTFDPNDRTALQGPQLRNRVFTDTFEPGSTLKPFPVAQAMAKGLVKANTMIETGNGRMTIGTANIGDTKKHGTISVADVVQVSSNIGTAKIALQLQPKEMWEFYRGVGFGQAPMVEFPGAVAGRIRPWSKWKPIEQATMSYGHGISVSLIQLAQAYTIFANEGRFVPVSLTKQQAQPVGLQVLPAGVAKQMLQMLEAASGPDGTAPKAQTTGYRVAGKTGTAHKQEGGRYVDKYISSYVGIAPASNPRVIVAVMVDEPQAGSYYGGLVAAPVFSVITRSVLTSLNVEPDAVKPAMALRHFVQAPASTTLGLPAGQSL